jgi:LCP family protein required for cell wall assembly
MEPLRVRAQPARKWKRSTILVAILSLVLAIVLGTLFFNAVRNWVVSWFTGSPNPFGVSRTSSAPGTEPPDNPFVDIQIEETPVPWDGTERVTILLMGLDFRDWERNEGPPRTDTMVLLTIDPLSKTAGMLSIPRDLWVEIPGYEHNRINTAYFLGETYKVPGGGPALAMKTVENLLGVPIQYYAVIEFSAFERMIDEIGGIDVLVKQRVKISPIGRTSIWLEAKPYHLDGAEALAYARARKTEGGDFDRAERQQQVALAIRDRIVGFDMLPTLITKAPALYHEIRTGVRTNIIDANAPPDQIIDQLQQLIGLGMLVLDIDPATIKKGVISPPDQVVLTILPSGADVLQPVPDQIRLLRDEIFTDGGSLGPSFPDADPLNTAALEGAKVAVLNGAGIDGLAGRTSDYLQAQGLNIVEVGNADRYYSKTVVIDYTSNPYTRQFLLGVANLVESQFLSQHDPESDVDLTIILGADWFLQ